MSTEAVKSKGEFWVIVGLILAVIAILVTIFGFILSINTRIDSIMVNMAAKADKADIARVEADIARVEADIARVEATLKSDIKEISRLLIDHIKDGHDHRKQKRQPASEPSKSKSQ